jgi:class 3 adenylate cyclase
MGCHRCGNRAQPGSRFCGSCGTPLGNARAGMRKTVTVLFADLAPAPGGDVESAVRGMEAVHNALRSVLERFGGTVERSAGDAVMAVFGIPTASEDDVRRAAAAALAVVAMASDLPGGDAIRVGVNTGEVLAGEGRDDQELAVGDAVVVAARLQQEARAGEVLLGPDTVRLLGGGARLGARRSVTLRGRVGSLSVVPLKGLLEVCAAHPRGPFVGRDSERRMVAAALERTVSGSVAQLVSILGEAGAGKTRLLREVVLEQATELRVLIGTCRAWGGPSQWQPLAELLHGAVDLGPEADARQVLQALRSRPELMPAMNVLESLLGGGEAPLSGDDLARALALVLAASATQTPLLVILEDAHLAEVALLDLIPDLIRRLEHLPVTVAVLARPELLDLRPGWGRGVRHALSMTLRPLTPELARQLAASLLDDDAAVGAAEAVVTAAGGNPLFLTHLAQDRAEGSERPLPTIAAVLTARLDRLPQDARHVLECASVVGTRGRRSDLVPLCEGEGTLDLDRELLVLARRELLEVEDGMWSFSSELLRDAAAAGLPEDERSALHRARGLLLAAYGDRAGASFHLDQAGVFVQEAAEVVALRVSTAPAGVGGRGKPSPLEVS